MNSRERVIRAVEIRGPDRVPITHATPAAFGAHSATRNDYADIAHDYLQETKPNILFGAVFAENKGMTPELAEQAGYKIVQDRKSLRSFR